MPSYLQSIVQNFNAADKSKIQLRTKNYTKTINRLYIALEGLK